jgi:hypothetical protein
MPVIVKIPVNGVVHLWIARITPISIYPKNRRGPFFYVQKPTVFEHKKMISRFLG